MSDTQPLANIVYVALDENTQHDIEGFQIDPSIQLPVEIPPGEKDWSIQDLRWEEIISAMLKILAHDPEHQHVKYYRAFVLAAKPDLKNELTKAGVTKARNSDHAIAIEIFKALEGLFPQCAATKLNLALVYEQSAHHYDNSGQQELAEANFSLAFAKYKQTTELDDCPPEAHFNFAHFYVDRKNFAKAKEHFQVFLEVAPDNPKASIAQEIVDRIDSHGLAEQRFKAAFDAIRMGREEEGIRKAKTFLTDHPEVWNAWFLVGWGHRRLHQYARAKDAFERVLKLHASHPDTLNELAICLMELGEYDRSYENLEDALRLEPDNTKIISNLGILALKRGNNHEARSFFKTVLAYDSEDPLAKQYLSILEKK